MSLIPFLPVAEDLELAGLIWQPEIGDEISERRRPDAVSILVDPQGMSPGELRSVYLWLPSVEQMVLQFEARQAILFHTGLEVSERALYYKTVIKSQLGPIESKAESLRLSMGIALRSLLLNGNAEQIN
jgi:hypothetical protein